MLYPSAQILVGPHGSQRCQQISQGRRAFCFCWLENHFRVFAALLKMSVVGCQSFLIVFPMSLAVSFVISVVCMVQSVAQPNHCITHTRVIEYNCTIWCYKLGRHQKQTQHTIPPHRPKTSITSKYNPMIDQLTPKYPILLSHWVLLSHLY